MDVFYSSDDLSSCSDSDIEKIATEVSNNIKKKLDKSKNVKSRAKNKKKGNSIKGKDQVNEIELNSKSPVTSHITQSEHSLGFIIDKSPLRDDVDPSKIGKPNTPNPNHEKNAETEKPQKNRSKKKNDCRIELSSTLQTGIKLSDNYLNMDGMTKKGISNKNSYDEIMKKSVITPDFEKQFSVAPYEESIRQQKKQRKKEKEKTKGKSWFNMEAPEMTEEKKNDLMVLKMRKALDPKRFYKNDDTIALPKYFQMGTVVESSADFYNSRIPKKQRKSNMVDELLADAEFRKYNKRKYVEIQEQKRKAIGPYKHMKRLKKNKR